MTAKGDFFPARVNQHVPNMQYAADVRFGGMGTIVIPAPRTATVFLSDLSGNEGMTQVGFVVDAKFGRNMTVTASAATGADSLVFLRGRDYLGQLMAEEFQMDNTVGTTAQVGEKAFKYVDSVEVETATRGATFTLKEGNRLGLPYKSQKLMNELINKETQVNGGTLTKSHASGVEQTLTSGDPRGLYVPHSSRVPNGSREYELTILHDRDNLHGDAHYFA